MRDRETADEDEALAALPKRGFGLIGDVSLDVSGVDVTDVLADACGGLPDELCRSRVVCVGAGLDAWLASLAGVPSPLRLALSIVDSEW